jgi:hypothetical protein
LSHDFDNGQSVSHNWETLKKIISGGQTGVDRAAVDFAIEHNIPQGGWCPKGQNAEDGSIAPKYLLRETPSSSYPQRNGVKRSGFGWQRHLFALADIDRRIKENRRLRDQAQEAVAASS